MSTIARTIYRVEKNKSPLKKLAKIAAGIGGAALVGDHLMGVGPKIDNGFKDNLSRIADAHPDSALAERYGSKDHKRIKTKQVLKKHGLM